MTRAVETDSGMKYFYGEAEITKEEYEALKPTENAEAVRVRVFSVSVTGKITEVSNGN